MSQDKWQWFQDVDGQIFDSEGRHVCDVYLQDSTGMYADPEVMALISSAPDLLTWAKWAAHVMPPEIAKSWQFEQLQKAIKKALGTP